MTVEEGKKLVEQLRNEIKEGKDVDFNVAWISSLNKSILKATQLGYEKAIKKILEMETQKMYAVEYKTGSTSTYEIFENYDDALSFANSNENAMFLFTADFNKDRIYLDRGAWNYDDFNDTFINKEIIETYEIHGK